MSPGETKSSANQEYHLMHPERSRLVILYGSQTGTALGLSERLALQAYRLFNSHISDTQTTGYVQPNLEICVQSMDSYLPLSRLAKETGIVLFVCSTTGYGAPPDNMKQFWKRIMHRNLPLGRAIPATLRFAVVGLGDSSYPKFNVVAKKLRKRLVQLGATALSITVHDLETGGSKQSANVEGLGLADEQSEMGFHGLLSQWIPRFWTLLSKIWVLQPKIPPAESLSWSYLESPNLIESGWPRFKVHLVTPTIEQPSSDIKNVSDCTSDRDVIAHLAAMDWKRDSNVSHRPLGFQLGWFRVVQNRRVTAQDHFQDTRLLELVPQNNSTSSTLGAVDFSPGDAFFVHPANSLDDAQTLLNLTNTDPDQRVTVTQHTPFIPIAPLLFYSTIDRGISAAWLATYYFDLNAIPGPWLFNALAVISRRALLSNTTAIRSTSSVDACARLQLEHDRLCELGSACWSSEAMDDLNDYVSRPHRRVIEILRDFPLTASYLTLTSWFDVLPGPIRPRPYSIASAPPKIELLVAVVTYKTLISGMRRGLASTYLASTNTGDLIPGWIASQVAGGFDFTAAYHTPTVPCLIVAPGTGIAPFRSFLWHQHNILSADETDCNHPVLLFFGCRYPDKDFYFSTEWDELITKHRIQMFTAFSRIPSNSVSGRVYVQHKLLNEAPKVWSVLSQPNSYVYVAGNAKSMPTEVRQALLSVCQIEGGLSSEAAEVLLVQMEAQRRIQIEAWS